MGDTEQKGCVDFLRIYPGIIVTGDPKDHAEFQAKLQSAIVRAARMQALREVIAKTEKILRELEEEDESGTQ